MLRIWVFSALLIAVFLYFKNDFLQLISRIKPSKKAEKLTVKSYMDKVNGKTKASYLDRAKQSVQDVLEQTQTTEKYSGIMRMAMLGAIIGLASGVAVKSFLLGIVLACGLYFVPMWTVQFKLYAYRKVVNDELEIALGLITTAYVRGNDIIQAVSENIGNIHYPVQEAFTSFLNAAKYAGSGTIGEIERMEARIDNKLFCEWCDLLILCQNDHTLKQTLIPVVNKFSQLKAQQNENETNMMLPIKNAVKMAAIVIVIIPLLYFFDSTWFYSLLGQVALAVTALVVFWCINAAIKLSAPIEYDI